jgi:hypothetical protein
MEITIPPSWPQRQPLIRVPFIHSTKIGIVYLDSFQRMHKPNVIIKKDVYHNPNKISATKLTK